MYFDKEGYGLYIPNDTSGVKDVIIYFPGDGGAGYDAGAMYEYVNSNPDKVVIISDTPYHVDPGNIYGGIDQAKSNGISIGSVNILGHSAGQNTAVDVASVAKDYGYDIDYVVSLDSATHARAFKEKGTEAEKLAENGTKLLMFDQRMTPISENNLQKFNDAGVPILYVYCSDGEGDFYDQHSTINEETVRDGIIDFICGDTDSIKDSSHFTYNYITYDKNRGEWISLSKSDAQKLITEGKVATTKKNEKVLSDGEYANSEMKKIKTTVTSSNLNNQKNISLPNSSITTSPQININTYNSIFSAITSLNDKINNELSMGIKIAEVYSTLDDNLKRRIANEILNENANLKNIFAKECTSSLINSNIIYNLDTIEGRFIYIYNELTNKYGYSETGAKAIIANMLAETETLDPDRHQFDDPNQPGYGLCQWEFSVAGGSGRADQMVEYCNKLGLDYTTIDGQLAWLDHELSTKYVNYGDNLYNDLKNGSADDYYSLTRRFCTFYEGPAYNNGDYRANNSKAKELFELLGTGAVVDTSKAVSSIPKDNTSIKNNTPKTPQTANQFGNDKQQQVASHNNYSGNTIMNNIASTLNNNDTAIKASNTQSVNTQTVSSNTVNNTNTPVYRQEEIVNKPVIEDTVDLTKDNNLNETIEPPINNIKDNNIEPIINNNKTVEINNNQKQRSNLGKTILTAAGLTAAVGATAGAVMYGVNKTKENNEIDDSEIDDTETNIDEENDEI